MLERDHVSPCDRDSNRSPNGIYPWATMRSVDDWLLANIFTRFPGVSRGRYPLGLLARVTDRWYPPLEGRMWQSRGCSPRGPSELCNGPSFGKLSGGNWMA